MGVEIERKYAVTGEFKSLSTDCTRIVQGYLCSDGVRTIRVRIRGEKGYITIKGKSLHGGLARFEWEKEIPCKEAEQLLTLCDGAVIDKHRFLVPYAGHTFEIDEFHGDNEGLVIAEVELQSENEQVVLPPFVGREHTGESRYYNACLRKHPYKDWTEQERSE